MLTRWKYAFSGMLAVILGTACSDSNARKNESPADDRTIPEAAAACGLNPRAVVRGLNSGSPPSLMVDPLYDNTTPRMTEAKECLRRWAAANGYMFVVRESVGEE